MTSIHTLEEERKILSRRLKVLEGQVNYYSNKLGKVRDSKKGVLDKIRKNQQKLYDYVNQGKH